MTYRKGERGQVTGCSVPPLAGAPLDTPDAQNAPPATPARLRGISLGYQLWYKRQGYKIINNINMYWRKG